DRLLLLLAQRTVTKNIRSEATHLLDQQVDWNQILRRSRIHHVSPLLHDNLKKFKFNRIPQEIRVELENRYRINAIWSVLSLRELKRILTQFSSAKIPVVPLKGLILAASLYGKITLRDVGDIDILIPR